MAQREKDMKKLWERSEILFAVIFIAIYVLGCSLLDRASEALGTEMILTLPFLTVFIALILGFIKRNGLSEYYALRAPKTPARAMLYYVPLLLISTVNIWFGIVFNYPLGKGIVYFLGMIAAGVAEELIFRGLLFRAMSRNNLRSAVIFTSLLFGLGHIVNLFNGSESDLLAGICQVFYAVSIGFLFAAALLRSGSLIPCMVSHAMFNSLSVFANEPMHERYQIPITISLCVLSAAAAIYYFKGARTEEKHEDPCSER